MLPSDVILILVGTPLVLAVVGIILAGRSRYAR